MNAFCCVHFGAVLLLEQTVCVVQVHLLIHKHMYTVLWMPLDLAAFFCCCCFLSCCVLGGWLRSCANETASADILVCRLHVWKYWVCLARAKTRKTDHKYENIYIFVAIFCFFFFFFFIVVVIIQCFHTLLLFIIHRNLCTRRIMEHIRKLVCISVNEGRWKRYLSPKKKMQQKKPHRATKMSERINRSKIQ